MDGGGGLDESSLDRGQRKENIVVDGWMAGVLYKVSRESSLRVFERVRAAGSKWESTRFRCQKAGEARFRRVDVGRRVRLLRGCSGE